MPGERESTFDPFSVPPRVALSRSDSQKIKEQVEIEKGRETPWVCEGEPPRGAIRRIENGKEVRKDPCEDQKIKDSARGIFAIYDGVSTAEGYRASSLAARESHAILSSSPFMKSLENFRTGEYFTDAELTEHVHATLAYAVRVAEEKLALDNFRKKKDASTTLSLALVVPMRDGTSRLFYANIGDSRVALIRDGKFDALSKEENIATRHLENLTKAVDAMGKPDYTRRISMEEAKMLEQAPSLADVPSLIAALRPPSARPENVMKAAELLFTPGGRTMRNTITDFVGREQRGTRDVEVKDRELKPGDVLVITSDGVHDNLLDAELADIVNANPNEAQAERLVSDAAEREALKAQKLPRSEVYLQRTKGFDDVSIVVRRIGVVEAPRPALKAVPEPAPKRSFMDMKAISSARAQAKRRAIPLSEAIQTPAQLESFRAEKEREEKIEALQNSLEHVEAEKMAIGEKIPPRFAAGMKVRLPVSGELATIASFDAAQDVYVFETQQEPRPDLPKDVANILQRSRRTIDRFVLESAQSPEAIPVFESDRMTVHAHEDIHQAVIAAIHAGKEHTLRSERIRAKLEALKNQE